MSPSRLIQLVVVGCVLGLLGLGFHFYSRRSAEAARRLEVAERRKEALKPQDSGPLGYLPRDRFETSGVLAVMQYTEDLAPDASLHEQGAAYLEAVPRGLASLEKYEAEREFHPGFYFQRAALYVSKGDAAAAYRTLESLESRIKATEWEAKTQYSVIFYKGVIALRIGENENCIACRGESSCIIPILPSAVHKNPSGSRLAIEHFSEYLRRFPDDLEVKWLLNLAHMTLGEHPDKVDPRYLLPLESYANSEFDIGKFRDVCHLVGLNRLNQAGGAIMEDFDNDGLLDIAVTCLAPSESMALYRNQGNGQFEDLTRAAGLEQQLGGLNCVQTDYNNDGYMDIYVPRGEWKPARLAQRPSLLRNNRNGTFTDVTQEAGLVTLANSLSATWADYDNDGWLDLFLCCRMQPSLLYHNRGDDTFEEVHLSAGLPDDLMGCLGAAWIDVDNDGYPELFVNLSKKGLKTLVDGVPQDVPPSPSLLFRNNRNGTFTDCTSEMGIDGPKNGFSCWAFDYDNDGWLDIFATSYEHTLAQVVQGLLNLPCEQQHTAKLYRNLEGKGFQDMTREAGVDKVYSPMGTNFGDLDNDGYLDFYLGTGDPEITTLVPKRLFKNVAGKRFAEISASSRMGHLQKGHGVAFGDWDRNGTQDVFIELGGAIHGDRYHNVMFQNPGHGNNWLSVKLIGRKTNRAAIGARIKVVTAGEQPQTVHRHVSSGSSFGANPLEQHFGLCQAQRVALLEIRWPRMGETQVFRDIAVNQGLVVTESEEDYETRHWTPIPLPE